MNSYLWNLKTEVLMTILNISLSVLGQEVDEIHSETFNVCWSKTFHLIYPTDVKYFSLGDENVVGEVVEHCPNVIRLKANHRDFTTKTNLSVVTADSKYYSYYVGYTEDVESPFRPEGDYAGQKNVKHTLCISDSKVTHIIFPANLQYVDFGDETIQVEKASGVENIITVKAIKPFATVTNLSAVTEQGKFYSFNISYDKDVEVISYLVDKNDTRRGQVAILDNREMNVLQKDSLRRQISHLSPRLDLDQENGRVIFSLHNIMVKDGTLFFKMCLENKSQINYTIDFIRFYIQDAKKTKKTALQQVELTPLFYFNYAPEVKYHQKQVFTAALEKFTIPDKKICIIEIQEAGGGRHFYYKLHNKHLLNAQVLLEQGDNIPEEDAPIPQRQAVEIPLPHERGNKKEETGMSGQIIERGADSNEEESSTTERSTDNVTSHQKKNARHSVYASGNDYYQQKLHQRQHVPIPRDEKVDNSQVQFNYFDYIDRPEKKTKRKKGKRR